MSGITSFRERSSPARDLRVPASFRAHAETLGARAHATVPVSEHAGEPASCHILRQHMLRWGRVAIAYLAASASAVAIAWLWQGSSPFVYKEPWLELPGFVSHVYSAVIGLALGGLVAFSTRVFVTRYAWARNLHRELRPVARDLSALGIVLVAAFSALGEELWFRGLLQPWVGLWLQAFVFGIVHSQLRGPSRWAWVSWATIMGLCFGATFALTGSLAGPIAAHALINCLNLNYLKSHDPEPRRRALGGLLGQRS